MKANADIKSETKDNAIFWIAFAIAKHDILAS